jgi:asparagine synthase (glutamine-hydrolysing)
MCGIAGAVCFDTRKKVSGSELKNVLGQQIHRGPDNLGFWMDEKGKCALGHNRLSIIDLSNYGNQPIISNRTGNVITYNGEIFNYQYLRNDLIKQGVKFTSNTDTEVILALYDLHGVECLQYLRGMFSFAIWNKKEEALFVARDRTGEKPFVYAIHDREFIFSSEINALTRHSNVSLDEDSEALNFYLQLQYIPAPYTIFKDIRKLPAAHYGIFTKDGWKVKRYWQVEYKQVENYSNDDLLEQLHDKLDESVRIRLIGDREVGTTLSGGVDSSLITALAAKNSTKPIKTFTIAVKDKMFDESIYAKKVSDRYSTEHHVEIIDENIVNLLSDAVEGYGEPFADKGSLPALAISQVASESLKVVLCGDGGDELLGGYPMYAQNKLSKFTSPLIERVTTIQQMVGMISKFQESKLSSKITRKILNRFIFPELQTLFYSIYFGDSYRRNILSDRSLYCSLEQWRTSLLEEAFSLADDSFNRMIHIQNQTYLPSNGLVKMDIASMNHSLEVRSPFVDHELIEFCATLPVDFKLYGNVPKSPLKRISERYFSRDAIYRKKQGFSIPVKKWLSTSLSEMMHDLLLDKNLMSNFNVKEINLMVNQFEKGEGDHEHRLWTLLIYALWQDKAKPKSTSLY